MVEDNSEHKKAKGVNRNIVATKSHNEYKDILLNKKCLRYSIEFKVKIIKEEILKSTKFHCLLLMTKYVSQTIDIMD